MVHILKKINRHANPFENLALTVNTASPASLNAAEIAGFMLFFGEHMSTDSSSWQSIHITRKLYRKTIESYRLHSVFMMA